MNLGDYLENDSKKKLLLPEGLKIGTVIKAMVYSTTPPKEKRFIIVGFNEDSISLASVLINSNINLRVNYCEELVSQHISLLAENRSYLTHDSHVDCSGYHPMDISELNEKIDSNPTIIIGEVDKTDLDLIMYTLVNSDFIKGKYKKKFGFYEYEP
jgi:hypothetical protein